MRTRRGSGGRRSGRTSFCAAVRLRGGARAPEGRPRRQARGSVVAERLLDVLDVFGAESSRKNWSSGMLLIWLRMRRPSSRRTNQLLRSSDASVSGAFEKGKMLT